MVSPKTFMKTGLLEFLTMRKQYIDKLIRFYLKINFIFFQEDNYLARSKGFIKKAKLKFDKRGEKSLRNQLRSYLSRELDNKNNKIFRDLKFADSRQNTLIQLADIIAGSVNAAFSGKNKNYLYEFEKAKRVEDIWDFK